MERINSPPKTLFCGLLFWHRNLHCRPICPFGLRGDVLHPTQPVCDLRFSSWSELLYDDQYDTLGGAVVLPPASNPLGCGRSSTCDMGSKKSFRGKTRHRFPGHLRSVCRGLCGLSFAFAVQHSQKCCTWHPDGLESVAGLGRSPFPHSTAPFPVVDGTTAFS